jgi:Transglycosylase SLT domain
MSTRALIIPLVSGWMMAAMPTGSHACEPLQAEYVKALVLEIAETEGIDPLLAAAVAEVESANGQNMVSNAGAVGVMQLMPGTASDMNVTDRCDPRQNVTAGLRYLKQQITTFGDPILALAAYNAGPNRVLQSNGIPVNAETTNYIIKILNIWKFRNRVTGAVQIEPPVKIATKKSQEINNDEGGWVDGHVLEIK